VNSDTDLYDPDQSLAYTPKEAAERLRVSRTALFARMKSGDLRSFRVGRSRRISDVALAEFIRKLEERSGASEDESRKK